MGPWGQVTVKGASGTGVARHACDGAPLGWLDGAFKPLTCVVRPSGTCSANADVARKVGDTTYVGALWLTAHRDHVADDPWIPATMIPRLDDLVVPLIDSRDKRAYPQFSLAPGTKVQVVVNGASFTATVAYG